VKRFERQQTQLELDALLDLKPVGVCISNVSKSFFAKGEGLCPGDMSGHHFSFIEFSTPVITSHVLRGISSDAVAEF